MLLALNIPQFSTTELYDLTKRPSIILLIQPTYSHKYKSKKHHSPTTANINQLQLVKTSNQNNTYTLKPTINNTHTPIHTEPLATMCFGSSKRDRSYQQGYQQGVNAGMGGRSSGGGLMSRLMGGGNRRQPAPPMSGGGGMIGGRHSGGMAGGRPMGGGPGFGGTSGRAGGARYGRRC